MNITITKITTMRMTYHDKAAPYANCNSLKVLTYTMLVKVLDANPGPPPVKVKIVSKLLAVITVMRIVITSIEYFK
jgi:hypothetical protein